MFKLIVLATFICAANAGAIAGVYSAAPALGAPLLGSVTYNAPEVNVVKQPITIDQPEVHYKAVPTIVHKSSVVQAAPALTYAAAPLAYNYNHLAYGAAIPAAAYAYPHIY